MSTTPRRIEYAGPEGWTVWVDEDGVHVRAPKGDALESHDVTRLFDLVTEVREHVTTGHVPAPEPLTPEQVAALVGASREEYTARRAARAVHDALSPSTTTVPF